MRRQPPPGPAWSALAACAASLALTACADVPVQVAQRPAPAASISPTARTPADGRACRVLLLGVQDLRGDPEAAGTFGQRLVQAQDAPGWLRAGLLSISRDPRLEVSDQTPARDAALVMKVDLLKLYMLDINTAQSANLVIRVHFTGPRALAGDDQLYRGAFTDLNWTGAAAEARGAMDVALSRALDQLRADLLGRCAEGPRPSS